MTCKYTKFLDCSIFCFFIFLLFCICRTIHIRFAYGLKTSVKKSLIFFKLPITLRTSILALDGGLYGEKVWKKRLIKIWKSGKKLYLCTPFEKRAYVKGQSSYEYWRIWLKKSIFFEKRFGSLKIMRTFAAPFEKRALARDEDKFIEKTDYCTRSKYREIQFIEKR